MSQKVFVVDSNILIQAKNSYYAFDVCRGFWNSLVRNTSEGRVVTIQGVVDEILVGSDELSEWVDSKFPNDGIKDESDSSTQQSYAAIIDWVESSTQFTRAAKDEYARVADGWLIAFAHAHGYTIVTHEVHDPNIKRRVPIPNVCNRFDVPYINTFQMLRVLSVSFICG